MAMKRQTFFGVRSNRSQLKQRIRKADDIITLLRLKRGEIIQICSVQYSVHYRNYYVLNNLDSTQ